MNFLAWLVIGGVLGWLASLVMRTDAQQGIILNVVVGIVGAFLGGIVLSPLFGTGTINQSDFSIASLFVSFLGAVILLAIVNLFRRRSCAERFLSGRPPAPGSVRERPPA
jgi:uncharacterized membrane protein YeaQ/YmgE (transglycosylase-associated protein family)